MLSKYAQENGLINPVFFTDDDYTGTNFNRPSFISALEKAEF
jgi:hypothetical protein